MENKKLIQGIELMLGGLSTIKSALESTEPCKMEEKTAKEVVEKPIVKEVESNVVHTREELEEMSYNKIKALVSQLGGKAVGKKKDLVDLVLSLENKDVDEEETGEVEESNNKCVKDEDVSESAEEDTECEETAEDGEDSEEEDSEEEEGKINYKKTLSELDDEEIIDVAKFMKIKNYKSKTRSQLEKAMLNDLDNLDTALNELIFTDTEEGGESEEASLQADLENLSVEELASICSENGLSTKGKKQALISRILDAIEEGKMTEDDIFENTEEDTEAEEDDIDIEECVRDLELSKLKEVAKELGIKVSKVAKKNALINDILAKDEDDIIDVLYDLGSIDVEEDTECEETAEDEEKVSDEVIKAEDELEKEIRAKYAKKKLKDSTIKKFLEKYYVGNPDCFDCTSEELLDCYIKVQRKFVDDECELHESNDYYERGGVGYCCGKPVKELENGNLYCEVCGEEYEIED